jgi:hypothetical protein
MDTGSKTYAWKVFELWDGELGISLGAFDSEGEALAAVRRLCAQSQGSRAPLGLVRDGRTVLATGEALVERAQEAARLSRA